MASKGWHRLRGLLTGAWRRARIRRYERRQWSQKLADEKAQANVKRAQSGLRDLPPRSGGGIGA